MKKFFALIVSVVLVIMTCVTASAESVANFNITLVSETDSEAVVTLDFNGGTGFSGLDFDMTVDSKRVKVTGAEKGAGFANFEKQAGTAFALININADPIKATVLTLNAFRIVDGKELFKITLKKLTKDKLDSDDLVIDITNCVDAAQQPIKVSLTTDLQGDKTEAPTSASSAVAPTDKTVVSVTDPTDATEQVLTNSIDGTSGELIDAEDPSDTEAATEEVGTQTQQENNGKNNLPIIIAVVAVVLVGAAVVAVIVIKKKKSDIGE
ncbi:MAG: hypothetical protein IIU80_02640 [Clostridia bacterium]|nr:hypothetical protein [Clostridia bacterium]